MRRAENQDRSKEPGELTSGDVVGPDLYCLNSSTVDKDPVWVGETEYGGGVTKNFQNLSLKQGIL